MPLLKKKKSGGMRRCQLKGDLEAAEEQREHFLRCSGMHTKEVEELVRSICSGKMNGPGLAYVAPALYEGIPVFLDKINKLALKTLDLSSY